MIVQVPATTANLGPGFDALGMALDIWNRFEFELNPMANRDADAPDVYVECRGEGETILPRSESNLVYQAFVRGLQEHPVPGQVRLRVTNNVPLSSGLGSSATAIVGGIAAAWALRGSEMTREDVINLASEMEGHPDNVAPAILGGLVVSVTRTDGTVTSLAVEPPPRLHVCLAVPDFYLNTRQARSRLPQRVSRDDAVFSLSRSALWVAALATGRLEALDVATEDVLHQPYRAALIPGLTEVFQAAKSAGALGVALSGSGPSVAAFCTSDAINAIGEAMRLTFRKVGVTARIFHTKPSKQGVQIEVVESSRGDVSMRMNA